MILQPALRGRRVMVVEDELLIAMMLEDVLVEQLCTVVGPFNVVDEALAAARTVVLDLAVLDVNVRGTKVYPVADILSARQIPFILLSGYGTDAVPADRPHWEAHAKPFQPSALMQALASRVSTG